MKACFSPIRWLRPGLCILALLFTLSGIGQGGNPFELSPRLAEPAREDSVAAPSDTGNPFDLSAPASGAAQQPTKVAPAKQAPAPVRAAQLEATNWRALLITIIGSLLVFTILLTLFRPQFGRAYRAFLNDNLLGQLQREREGGGGLPYYLFYGLFLINGGLFLYLLSQFFGYRIHPNGWIALGYCVGAVTAAFLGKHLLISILSYIFPIEKEARLYNFTIIVFSIMLGVYLIVVNMMIAYAPEHLTKYIIFGSFIPFGATYIFRTLRGLFLARRFLAFHKFHFLLYICTVEIAPVLVLVRLAMG
ncbi:MAG: DUF4271 domain-containing protein [Lewinellaceae bacterium]|nr:DUF4271 domain-containing protein [Lewinellaceae bacterium]